jgi:hypothetical protein
LAPNACAFLGCERASTIEATSSSAIDVSAALTGRWRHLRVQVDHQHALSIWLKPAARLTVVVVLPAALWLAMQNILNVVVVRLGKQDCSVRVLPKDELMQRQSSLMLCRFSSVIDIFGLARMRSAFQVSST